MGLDELRRWAGSLIIGGFEGLEPSPQLLARLASEKLGGVIVFKRNVHSLAQVAALNSAIATAAGADQPPVFISVDQEGGPVARLRGLITDFPPMAVIGGLEDPDLCHRLGKLLGAELKSVGFNTDYAPVLDVHTNPDNPIIGPRSFSSDSTTVGRLGVPFAQGLLAAGVVPCMKHFPGHGDTEVDSHVGLPVVHHPRKRLEQVEWSPFQLGIDAGLPLIMTAHVTVSALDAEHPATLSQAVVNGALRRQLGFQGCVISDDLEMAAVADRYAVDEMVELGLIAGVDLFLICHQLSRQAQAFETLVHLGEQSSSWRERIGTCAARVRNLRLSMGKSLSPPTDYQQIVKCPQHLKTMDELRQRCAGRFDKR